MKPFANYEISPCRRYEEPDAPGKFYFEVCEPHEADVWTLYGHINGEGVQAIGDFSTREAAEEVFERIAGIAFTGSYAADARVRIMHAGPKLLDALRELLFDIQSGMQTGSDVIHFDELEEGLRLASLAIAEATGRTA
jgi:hypothetical protein